MNCSWYQSLFIKWKRILSENFSNQETFSYILEQRAHCLRFLLEELYFSKFKDGKQTLWFVYMMCLPTDKIIYVQKSPVTDVGQSQRSISKQTLTTAYLIASCMERILWKTSEKSINYLLSLNWAHITYLFSIISLTITRLKIFSYSMNDCVGLRKNENISSDWLLEIVLLSCVLPAANR